jgi:hypothetical protein
MNDHFENTTFAADPGGDAKQSGVKKSDKKRLGYFETSPLDFHDLDKPHSPEEEAK